MNKDYITMHDELMEKKWCICGSQLEISILSVIQKPKEWRPIRGSDGKRKYPDISQEQKVNNRLEFLKDIISKTRAMKPLIEVIENDERIFYELDLLNRENYYFEMPIFVNIGYKRNARMMMRMIHDTILKDSTLLNIEILYVDNRDYKCREEAQALLDKMIGSFNGFCGTLGLESNVNDIIRLEELQINIGDGESYGIENVRWRTDIHGWK